MKTPVVLVTSGTRGRLLQQTLETLNANTRAPYKLLMTLDASGFPMYIKSKTAVMNGVDFDWYYGVFVDDDVWFSDGWLGKMQVLMDANQDIWALAGTSWSTHRVIEQRDGLNVMDTASGPCFMLRREVWDEFKPLALTKCWDDELCQRIRVAGGKVATLSDPTVVVHCGIKCVTGKGRSSKAEAWMRELAARVGAIAE